ncbi:MAG: hypothetical protein JWR51_3433 [Devosia sp.]|uniref:hypothetical protein n=1 Tax=Devosia sp. TaxID=1871048 RepID=UPI0026100FCB|nr:hypothetical protein [Devosia sp.]MDB5530330.1 hypothetical protein [Devosia sp.]
MPPVIDDDVFEGSGDGLGLPVRRLAEGPFGLEISGLDRADPPGYSAGGVPRADGFNGNVFELPVTGGMPEIKFSCKVSGFDPKVVPVIWRLQTRHVLGRFSKVSGGETPHYRSKVAPLSDEWRGESGSAALVLFPKSAPAEAHVGGAHAILSVAVKPPGAANWLQDYVHLRIVGTNPDEKAVRAFIRSALPGRDQNLHTMLDAIFAWEAGFKQFASGSQNNVKYKGVRFTWPRDPTRYPVGAFDFGIGLSQFTHPNDLAASIAWDWRDNMRAGINIFLDALRKTHKAGITWIDWAIAGWTRYNGAPAYAAERAKSDDGKLVSKQAMPAGLNVAALTKVLPLTVAPTWPAWPADGLLAGSTESFAAAARHSLRGITAIGSTLARVQDRDLLLWLWPQFERQVREFDPHRNTPIFPGLDPAAIEELVSALDEAELEAALNHALATALVGTGSSELAASRGGLAAAVDLNAEWSRLSPFVQNNVDGKFAGYQSMRGKLFAQFGAPGDPDKAIARINAYYTQLVSAGFPKANSGAPVHPNLKACFAKAAALAATKNASAAIATMKKIGGFVIRPNVNSPDQLSMHSFGSAADIDWDTNPNIKEENLPLDLIAAITGVDLYGPESELLRTPAAYDTLLPAAKVISKANADFMAAFKNDAGFKAATATMVKRRLGLNLTATELTKAHGFATAQPPKTSQLEVMFTDKGATPVKARAMAKLAGEAAALFRKAATTTAPSAANGKAATVARFGFCTHAPEAIAALVASDGGGLRWLGAARGTKDFMHFELFAADRPALF